MKKPSRKQANNDEAVPLTSRPSSKKRPVRNPKLDQLFSPFPRPRAPQPHTIFPERKWSVMQKDGKWGEYRIPAIQITIPDAEWLTAQLEYQKNLREWKINEGGRQAALEEREQIVASCKKWCPIYDNLNKAFKKLWKLSEYESSELRRKEIRGKLAENLSIPVKDVEASEWSLKKRSPKGGKTTPSQAMYRRVAREFPGRGEKTIEKVWGDYKRRKISTTPVAERTA